MLGKINPEKDYEAITKILSRVFNSRSILSYGAVQGSFKIIRPNHSLKDGLFFWGGIRFEVNHAHLGLIQIRIEHDKGSQFRIAVWTLVGLNQTKLRIQGLMLNDLEDRAAIIISNLNGLTRWPTKCDFDMGDLEPLFGSDCQNGVSRFGTV